MSRSDPDLRTGLILIRMWPRAGDDGDVLMARLTIKVDVQSDATEYAVTDSVDALCAQVRGYAEAFLAAGGSGP
jgi:hypothetical protein